jgi:hypothetical protein
MPTPAQIDERVLEAVGCATPENPQDLVGILHYVDSRERLVLTYEELVGSLERLTRGGAVEEVRPHHFRLADHARSEGRFTPITRQMYDVACEAYVRSVTHAKA